MLSSRRVALSAISVVATGAPSTECTSCFSRRALLGDVASSSVTSPCSVSKKLAKLSPSECL
ncbi:hypothetical protein PF010_g22157 [Phytophthora fragariae]|uniref:Uncharacterized protein n=1 Tax=Phytophthora fragariae TaxID=53985 RepID=A0A6A3QQC6_9STRA|nr:hypothetical protein PF010_g22157 [Phytophthora fragariae]KAE9081153.1 hypothetical protein PF007_g22779 [Phytophthora fragariae]KAE9191938.1 hypothetical protein PF004_g21460 [Phytophthora fragariae]